MFRLLEKLFFVFHTIFKFDFITQDNYCIIHKCLYSPFILFFSYISFSETEYRNNDNSSYSYDWQKFNDKMNEKRSQEHQSMDPEYVTGQINSRILGLLLKQFFCLVFAPSRKS